jgi:DHA1 family bicyclomycin/chloramphenicol resistance-like MFS transporter
MFLVFKLPETSPTTSQNMFKNYKIILLNKKVMLLMLAGSFGISGLFLFITKSSFIYVEYFKLDEFHFSFVFTLNVIGLMFMTKVNMQLLEKYSSYKLLLFGIYMQLIVATVMYLFSRMASLWSVMIGFIIYLSALGFIFGNVMTLILEDFKEMSASANALNGVIGFIMAVVIGFLSSYIHDGNLGSIFLIMIIIAIISLAILRLRGE